jgi:hypothetical protein
MILLKCSLSSTRGWVARKALPTPGEAFPEDRAVKTGNDVMPKPYIENRGTFCVRSRPSGSMLSVLTTHLTNATRLIKTLSEPYLSKIPTAMIRSSRAGAAALIVCFCVITLHASTTRILDEKTVYRSARTVPRKFIIFPKSPTVTADQMQRFGVVDVDGNEVAVRWSLSGVGCEMGACGEVDEYGIYKAPSTLSNPRAVVLEGVVIADPRYSVLTEIHLEAAHQAATLPHEVIPPAMNGRHPVLASSMVPLPSAIPGIPDEPVKKLLAYSRAVPLPQPVGPAPIVEVITDARPRNLPLVSVIPAPPAVPTQSATPRAQLLALPRAIEAPPTIPPITGVRQSGLLLVSSPVSAPPELERQQMRRETRLLPLPLGIPPAPLDVARDFTHAVRALIVAGVVPPPPDAHDIVSTRQAQTLALLSAMLPPQSCEPGLFAATLPFIAPPPPTDAAPALETSRAPSTRSLLLLPQAVSNSPTGSSGHLSPSNQLLPLPLPVDSPNHDVQVTYQNGLLTIDADDTTLADVLRLIALKTGATIEIPPGTGTERIIERAGPGPAKDVIAHLLDGSSFNFVIVSSVENPQDPAQVLLSVQKVEPTVPGPASAVAAASPSPLWTPPDETLSVAVLPASMDNTLTAPKEPMTPDALGEFMRAKFRELREKAQQQYPQQ